MLIGIGAKQLIDFQRPYSLDAESEPTIEITDAKRVIDSTEKPAIRNQVGRLDVPSKNTKSTNKSDETIANAARKENDNGNRTVRNNRTETTSVSGKVVNNNGEVISGQTLTVKPVITNRFNQLSSSTPVSQWEQAMTDKQGGFTFTNISAGTYQFVLLPEAGSDYTIKSLNIGNLTFYPPGLHPSLPHWFGTLTFNC